MARMKKRNLRRKDGVWDPLVDSRQAGAGSRRAADAAIDVALLPARLYGRRFSLPRGTAPRAAAARTAEDRDGAFRARHQFDDRDVRRCAHSRTRRRRLGREERDAAQEPDGRVGLLRRGSQVSTLCSQHSAQTALQGICRRHRRRAGRDGGGQPRRRRNRRAVDRPQHRAAARAGAEPLRDAGTFASTSIISPSARCTSCCAPRPSWCFPAASARWTNCSRRLP